MKFKNILNEEFQVEEFLKDYLDYYWYWLGAGKRFEGLSGNPTAQKKEEKLYDKYDSYINVYDFNDNLLDVHSKHTEEFDKEHPELQKYERTKLYDIKSAPERFEKMKKFLKTNGSEIVKKFLRS